MVVLCIGPQRVVAQAHALSQHTGILPVMHFSPHTISTQACWHCTHFQALVYQATAARCLRAGRLSIQAAPTTGCVFWQREVGADDEPGPPVSEDGACRLVSLEQAMVVAWAP